MFIVPHAVAQMRSLRTVLRGRRNGQMNTYRKRATAMAALRCGSLNPAVAAGPYGINESGPDECGPGMVSSGTFCTAVWLWWIAFPTAVSIRTE